MDQGNSTGVADWDFPEPDYPEVGSLRPDCSGFHPAADHWVRRRPVGCRRCLRPVGCRPVSFPLRLALWLAVAHSRQQLTPVHTWAWSGSLQDPQRNAASAGTRPHRANNERMISLWTPTRLVCPYKWGAFGSRAHCRANHMNVWHRCKATKMGTAGWLLCRSSNASSAYTRLHAGKPHNSIGNSL